MDELIHAAARAERLLVVSDFDGTLAEFSTDIYNVPVNEDALAALHKLAGLPDTAVAILSGRHLEGLLQVMPLRSPVIIGASHGAETLGQSTAPTEKMLTFLDQVSAQLHELTKKYPGTFVEEKPFQRGFHTLALSQRDPQLAKKALADARQIPHDGFFQKDAKNIVEFSASPATKGSWIEAQRDLLGATAVVFLGDDVTDEDGFQVLCGKDDISVKVGPGETAAKLRLPDIAAVAEFLSKLADARQASVA
ncbi:MAG: trehalose-phosphatase [Corynebacterium sp.]|nr:trehalose-phosphatase [Corynebacterium sp.]